MKSIRTTATRLDRFKKPDHWTQRRIEEGFACFANSFELNNYQVLNLKFKMANKLKEPFLNFGENT